MERIPNVGRLTSQDIARLAAETAADARATDIQVLDLTRLSPFFDLFVLCTADNTRQLRALIIHITHVLEEAGIQPLAVEGEPESGWVVLDYGSVVIHVLTPDRRTYYRLEDHWAAAQRVLVIQ